MLYRSLHNRDWKRVTSLQTAFLKWISLNGNTFIVILISARLVLGSPTDTKPAFVQVMVSWWRHQMEFSALLALCEGNPPVTGGSPQKGQFWCFLLSPEQTVQQKIETPVIWDVIALIMTSLYCWQPTVENSSPDLVHWRIYVSLGSDVHFIICMIFTHWSVGSRLNLATSSWFA